MKFLSFVCCLLALCYMSTPAPAVPLTFADTFIVDTYVQNSTAAPVSASSAFFTFGASMQNANDFNTASATYPPFGTSQLSRSGTTFSSSSQTFINLATLHNAFPFGIYTITATNTVNNSSQKETFNYTADHFTTSVPTITPSTYNALQSYNPSLPMTLAFNSFTKGTGTSSGFTVIWIDDTLTGNRVLASDFLTPTTTSLLIPANTLSSSRNYAITLIFTSRMNVSASTSQTTDFQGFDVRTVSGFRTINVPEPATLLILTATALCLFRRRG